LLVSFVNTIYVWISMFLSSVVAQWRNNVRFSWWNQKMLLLLVAFMAKGFFKCLREKCFKIYEEMVWQRSEGSKILRRWTQGSNEHRGLMVFFCLFEKLSNKLKLLKFLVITLIDFQLFPLWKTFIEHGGLMVFSCLFVCLTWHIIPSQLM